MDRLLNSMTYSELVCTKSPDSESKEVTIDDVLYFIKEVFCFK